MAKTSAHTRAYATLAQMANQNVHNERLFDDKHPQPWYILNEKHHDPRGNVAVYRDLTAEAVHAEYLKTNKFGKANGRLHHRAKPFRETVVVCEHRHDADDLNRLIDRLEAELPFRVFAGYIHRDEGFMDKKTGLPKYNYHMHITHTNLRDGQLVNIGKEGLRKLQDICAETLGMERGNTNAEGAARPHLTPQEYRAAMQAAEIKIEQVLESASPAGPAPVAPVEPSVQSPRPSAALGVPMRPFSAETETPAASSDVVAGLEARAERAERALAAAQADRDDLVKARESAVSDLERLQGERDSVVQDLADAREALADAEFDKMVDQSAVESVVFERDQLQEKLNQVQGQIDQVGQARVETSDRVRALERERDALRDRVSEVEQNRDAVSERVSALERDRDSASEGVDGIVRERDALRDRVSVLERETASASEGLAGLVRERDALRDRVSVVEGERDSARVGLAGLERERDALSDRAAVAEGERDSARAGAAVVLGERDTARARAVALQRELDAAVSGQDGLRSQLAAALADGADGGEAALAVMQQERDRARRALVLLKEDHDKLAAALETARSAPETAPVDLPAAQKGSDEFEMTGHISRVVHAGLKASGNAVQADYQLWKAIRAQGGLSLNDKAVVGAALSQSLGSKDDPSAREEDRLLAFERLVALYLHKGDISASSLGIVRSLVGVSREERKAKSSKQPKRTRGNVDLNKSRKPKHMRRRRRLPGEKGKPQDSASGDMDITKWGEEEEERDRGDV